MAKRNDSSDPDRNVAVNSATDPQRPGSTSRPAGGEGRLSAGNGAAETTVPTDTATATHEPGPEKGPEDRGDDPAAAASSEAEIPLSRDLGQSVADVGLRRGQPHLGDAPDHADAAQVHRSFCRSTTSCRRASVGRRATSRRHPRGDHRSNGRLHVRASSADPRVARPRRVHGLEQSSWPTGATTRPRRSRRARTRGLSSPPAPRPASTRSSSATCGLEDEAIAVQVVLRPSASAAGSGSEAAALLAHGHVAPGAGPDGACLFVGVGAADALAPPRGQQHVREQHAGGQRDRDQRHAEGRLQRRARCRRRPATTATGTPGFPARSTTSRAPGARPPAGAARGRRRCWPRPAHRAHERAQLRSQEDRSQARGRKGQRADDPIHPVSRARRAAAP